MARNSSKPVTPSAPGPARQRLIGVILLLLLAAIIAPLLFRGPEEVRVALELDIPAPPPVSEVEPEPVVTESEVNNTREAIERERQAPRDAAQAHLEAGGSQASGSAAAPALSGWAVQVASFSRRQNAVSLEKSLRDRGYNAYWRRVDHDGEVLYRVFTGPELNEEDARMLKRRLAGDENFGLDGLVVPYEP